MFKNKERVEKVALFVAEHYRSTVEPMGYKAFLVGVDREACAFYKEALDKYLPSEYSKVIISTQGKRDSEHLRQYQLSEDQEQSIRKCFRKPEELPKILIVTEKLLTGFDAPILYCMYLDKPMRDHVLLQAIARVNRPYEDEVGRRKPCGFVLDFVGIFDRLEKALAFDSKDVEGVIEGMDLLKAHFRELMDKGRTMYLSIQAGKKGDKAAEAILEYFHDKEQREAFYSFFEELEELHEIISPDLFMRPFLDDYTELASMYDLVKASYDRNALVDKCFLRKTEELVREHTATPEIERLTKLQKLDANTLLALANADQPDTLKVFSLLKAIDQLAEQEADREPYLLSIGDKAKQIAQAFEDRQKDTQETLEKLRQLIREINEARREREDTEHSAESFAVYWLLKQQGISQADVVAKAVGESFAQYPHWLTSHHQEQEVRKTFYKSLINSGVQDVVDVAQGVLNMLRRAR